MDGILNLYKEKGFTSHDVVAIVRKVLNTKKVGHTGTLDPDAEGVLPICVGKATKAADYIMADTKCYRAELTFGANTTTQDQTGQITERFSFEFDSNKIQETVAAFVGEITQIPPMYSAVKVNGKKLYELAREGKEIERKPRKIQIYSIQILEFLPPDKIRMEVTCSKGTYIRTLCQDIGNKLGWGGYMSSLLRTASGQFRVENSIPLDVLKHAAEQGEVNQYLIPVDQGLGKYPSIQVSQKGSHYLYHGGRVYEPYFSRQDTGISIDDIVRAYDWKGNFIGLYTLLQDAQDNRRYIKPLKLFL